MSASEDRPIAAVVYAAKSTEDTHGSIETQLADCRAACAREGREVVFEDRDEAKSGFHGNRGNGLARCKAEAAKSAAERGSAELWVQHSDRLARGDGLTADHLAEIFFAMRRAGVRLRSVQDDANLEDAIRAVLIGERNHEDSKRKSAATRAGKRRRFDAGKPVGGRPHDGYRLVPETTADGKPVVLPDGRVSHRRELDPERMPIIARIFDLVELGLTFGDVQRQLNAERLRTRPTRRHPDGLRWTTRRIRETAQDPYYAGFVVAYGERRQGDHPPLVDQERFDRIQAGLRRLDQGAVQRRKGGRRPAEEYILRGVAFCSCCGDVLYTRRKAAGRVYICRNRREATGLCSAPVVLAEALETAVLAHLDDLVPELETWIAEKAVERRGERAVFERAVADRKRALAERSRDVELLRSDYRAHLRAGDDGLARIALEEAERTEVDRDHLALDVEHAAAQLAEWDVTPGKLDAALDFYSNVSATIQGRIRQADDATQLRGALADLLNGVWVRAEDGGRVTAEFSVRTPDDADQDWRYVEINFPQPLALDRPQWVRSELDASRTSTAA